MSNIGNHGDCKTRLVQDHDGKLKALKVEEIFYVNDRPYFSHGVLGKGASAVVYKVSDEKGTIWALKRVHAKAPRRLHAFCQEVELLKSLRGHPNIVRMEDFDLCEEDCVL